MKLLLIGGLGHLGSAIIKRFRFKDDLEIYVLDDLSRMNHKIREWFSQGNLKFLDYHWISNIIIQMFGFRPNEWTEQLERLMEEKYEIYKIFKAEENEYLLTFINKLCLKTLFWVKILKINVFKILYCK